VLADRQFLFSLPGRENPIPQVGLGIRIDDRASGANLPPPRLGEHTEDVLREWAGCDDRQIAALRAERII
jgi:crotonobetainyl-CoA:carnitine CoA-transferase CaiB-like acyl-CoA transferase